ncbi:MAG: DUF1566 domain-containing protein [Myxococcaceae bacterium]|nr:DUF1566 domain-containing protein [Myxococcaceae bacterium]
MRHVVSLVALLSLGAAPRGRYLSAAGTVTDRETGLVWAQQTLPAQSFSQAQAACAASRVGGSQAWRLASIKELQSLLDDSGLQLSLDPAFRAFRASWSSTPGRAALSHWVLQVDLAAPVTVFSDSTVIEVLCVH